MMTDLPPSERSRPFRTKLRELGLLTRAQEAGLPRFLILGSEHSGARQLAQLLSNYPGCSLPESLGTKFFSTRHQWCDLDWYIRALGHDVHQVRGEWTPSYALLPVKTIRLIHELVPDIKLIWMLGDPAITCFEACGRQHPAERMRLQEQTAQADYPGQIRRWRSVFPVEQMWVGFEHDVRAWPRAMLDEVSRFLGNERGPSERQSDLPELLDEAVDDPIPTADIALVRAAWANRTAELAEALRRSLGTDWPAKWQSEPIAQLDASPENPWPRTVEAVAAAEFDDIFLHGAVALADDAVGAAQWLESLCGYDLYLVQERVAAIPAGRIAPGTQDADWNHVLWADDLPSLRDAVLRSSAPGGGDFADGSAPSLNFATERFPIYGDVPMRLTIQGYRGFKIVGVGGQYLAIAPDAAGSNPAQVSPQEFARRVEARLYLPAPTIPLVLAAVDAHFDQRLTG